MPEANETKIEAVSESSVRPAVTAGRLLLYLNAGVWVTLGAVTYSRPGPMTPTVASMVAALMVANALVMAWIAARLGAGTRRVFLVALAIMAVNILLTVTDEFGLVDLAVLVLELVTVVVLLSMRDWYLGAGSSTNEGPPTDG